MCYILDLHCQAISYRDCRIHELESQSRWYLNERWLNGQAHHQFCVEILPQSRTFLNLKKKYEKIRKLKVILIEVMGIYLPPLHPPGIRFS